MMDLMHINDLAKLLNKSAFGKSSRDAVWQTTRTCSHTSDAEFLMPGQSPTSAAASREDVRRLLGDIDDAEILGILALKPSIADLEEAAVWATGDGDVLDRSGRPLAGVAAKIVEILDIEPEEPLR
jgi:hypothetical protein